MADDTIPPEDEVAKKHRKAAAYRRAWYARNRDHCRAREARYRAANLEKHRLRQREWRRANPQESKKTKEYRTGHAAYMREYRANHPEKVRPTQRKYAIKYRSQITLQQKIGLQLRARTNKAIKKGYKSGSAVRDLGCTITYFIEYIARLFQPGMSWDNWGKGKDKWHLDHIKPLSSFDLTDRNQFLIVCHFSNYQPLWSSDNLRKNNKF